MKKIKSMFEKHDLIKIVSIAVLITIVLTWVIPAANLSNGSLMESNLSRQGLFDIFLSGVYGANFFIQQIMFIVFVGMFYGILSNISGYKTLVSKIAKKLNGKEKVFVLVSSIIVTLLASLLTQTYVVFIFVPFILAIASKLNIDKMTAFLCTFGSILVGALGATYGSEGFIYFIKYLNYYQTEATVTKGIGIRFGILALSFALYSFFTLRYMKKNASNKLEQVEDLFATKEEDKKVKVWPMALCLGIIAVFTILGYFNWEAVVSQISELVGKTLENPFTKFHTWLYELSIGDYTIFAYILGKNATAFGEWNLYAISVIMVICLLLSVIIYRVKFDDMIDYAVEGLKKVIKPLIILLLVYTVFVFVYWNNSFTVTICHWITSFASEFNPFLATLSAMVSGIFHIDFGFAAYLLGEIFASTYSESFSVAMLVYVTIHALVQFVAPTSAILMLGLSYMEIPYTKWMKYIWKFALIMLGLLLIIFALLTYL